MNQKAAKIPNEHAWQTIDIYLFSNGQQYSPTRKYHLNAEDLNCWSSTLNYLARSHYGMLHEVIELYSLNGSKVEGPLYLQDGMTYVAVVPPDEFINSGYEKYLIKASRSWEKRQAKRSSAVNNHISNKTRQVTDSPQIVTSMENSCINSTELITINASDKNVVIESILEKTRKITPKLPKSTIQRPWRNSNISTARSDKKRLTTKNTAVMKTPNMLQHTRNIPSFKNKESLYRQAIAKVPVKHNIPINDLSLKMHKITNPPYKSTPQNMKIAPQLQSPLLQLNSPLSLPPPTPMSDEKTTFSNIEKQIVTDSLQVSNTIVGKEKNIRSTENYEYLYQNVDSETKSANLEAPNSPIVDEAVSYNMTGVEKQVQTQIESFMNGVTISNKCLSFINNKIILPTNIQENSNIMTCNIPIDNKYIAIINKGHVISMNLYITFQNNETSHQKHSKHTEVRKASSLIDLQKLRKSQSCSVIRCCGNNTAISPVDVMPIYKNDKDFFILMSKQAQSQNRRIPSLQKLDKLEFHKAYNDLSLSVMESYTQTEWSKVWLEVRLREDGRYSFHLPPLSVLRKLGMLPSGSGLEHLNYL